MQRPSLTFAQRLYLSSGVIVLLSAVLALFMLWRMQSIHGDTSRIERVHLARLQGAEEIRRYLAELRAAELLHAMVTSNDDKAHAASVIRQFTQALQQALRDFDAAGAADPPSPMRTQLDAAMAQFARSRARLLELSNAVETRFSEARKFAATEAAMAYAAVDQPTRALIEHERLQAARASQQAERTYRQAIAASLAGLLVLMAVGVGATLLITRSLAQPVREAVAAAQAIANGHLRPLAATGRADEIGTLQRALNDMVAALCSLVGRVQTSSSLVQGASSEIASGVGDLAARTEQASAELQRVGATMDGLRSATDSTEQELLVATGLVDHSARSAQLGHQSVRSLVDNNDELASDSGRIGEIVHVIDGIAFQTNILALNAAIEAAGAGTHGKGFAAVAKEIGELSQRSAAASKEISALIRASVQRIDRGRELGRSASAGIDELLSDVQRFADIVARVRQLAGTQAQHSSELGRALDALETLMQQNAAMVEQAAAAAASMSQQAGDLAHAASVFRIEA